MRCPHCQKEIRENPATKRLTVPSKRTDLLWALIYQECPACCGLILELILCKWAIEENGRSYGEPEAEMLIYPRVASRPSPPAEVPKEFAEDYVEASLIITDSPKASAALSRTCLQHVLREKAGVKHQDLAKEIQQVLDSKTLPSHLADAIDAVRNIGNFAAHPIKSTASGNVVQVEAGEAEWNLDVLDGLFDFYFVQPAILKERRAALNAKLTDAGKPMLK
jgi:Domain of unknown function (DUF4145)